MRLAFSVAVIGAWAGLACFGWLLPLDPATIDLTRILEPPGRGAWLGYDDLGRSLWDRVVVGARYSFFVALFVVSLSAVVGTTVGTLSAWFGGWLDHALTRIIDVFLAFPGILLAIALAGVLGAGLGNVVIALAAVGWVGFARLARAQVLAAREREHVQAAIALGARPGRIVMWHLLPLISAPLIVEATFGVAAVVIAEAGLSFLGLGIQPPEPSWGSMIRDSSRYMLVSPHMVVVPGTALLLVVLAVNLFGDWLRDRMDVRLAYRRRP